MREDLLKAVLDVFERSAIGFNRIVPTAVHSANLTYPPVNIVKDGEGKFTVEMALAGYTKDDIKITKNNNFVVVEGSKEKEKEEKEYYFHGIAARSFKREFPIANGVEVVAAGMTNGILSIAFNNTEATTKQIPVL